MWGLNKFQFVRKAIVRAKWYYYTKFWGMDIDPTANYSLDVRFDKTFPKGVHIGAETYVAFEAAILTHDLTRGLRLHTRIGRRCFIGARSIILPGIEIGDEVLQRRLHRLFGERRDGREDEEAAGDFKNTSIGGHREFLSLPAAWFFLG